MEKWQLRLFGGLQVVRGDEEIVQFPTKRAGLILARLAISRNASVGRDELAETLWPEDFLDSTRVRLRQELKRLREALGSAGEIIQSDRTWIRLDTDLCEVDLRNFEHHLRQAKGASDRLPHLLSALELYDGPLLPEYQEDWVLAARQELRSRALLARCEASNDLRATNPQAALDEALAAVRQDPLYEPAIVALIRSFLATGDAGGARRTYQEYDRTLQRERRSPSEAVKGLFDEKETSAEFVPTEIVAPPTQVSQQQPLPDYVDTIRGRSEDMQTLREQLDHSSKARLVTLVGPAGVGKSRLAVEVARSLADQYRSVSFVVADEEPVDGLTRRLDLAGDVDGPALIVLDNVETVLDFAAEQVRLFLSRFPRAKIIATSRQRLGIAAEHIFPLQVLPVPVTERGEQFTENPSVQMFLDRVRQLRPNYRVGEEEELFLGMLLSRLDGLPLAIELAAARATSSSISELTSQTDERFTWLTTKRTDLPQRQRSLWAAIDASYQSLDEDAKQAAKLLSMFPGGGSSDAVRDALGSEASVVLDELVERSMLIRIPQGNTSRYTMLVSIREFLRLQMSEAEQQDLARRHASVYAKILRQLAAKLGGDTQSVLDNIERESENGCAALRWATKHDPVLALELALGMWRFFCTRSRPLEGRNLMMPIASMKGVPRGVPYGEFLFALAATSRNIGDLEECQKWFGESEKEFERTRHFGAVAWVQMNDAGLALEQLDYPRALQKCLQVKAFRESEGKTEYGIELAMRAAALIRLGHISEGVEAMEAAFATRLREAVDIETAKGYYELGWAYREAGQLEKAVPLIEEGVAKLREIGSTDFLIWAILELIETRLDLGKSVHELMIETEELLQKVPNGGKVAHLLLLQSRLRIAEGRRREAAQTILRALNESSKARAHSITFKGIQAAVAITRSDDVHDQVDALRQRFDPSIANRLIDQLVVRLVGVQ